MCIRDREKERERGRKRERKGGERERARERERERDRQTDSDRERLLRKDSSYIRYTIKSPNLLDPVGDSCIVAWDNIPHLSPLFLVNTR